MFLACSKLSTSASCHHHYYHCHHFNYYHPCPTTWKQCSEVMLCGPFLKLPPHFLSKCHRASQSLRRDAHGHILGWPTHGNQHAIRCKSRGIGEVSTAPPMGPVSFSFTPSHPVLHKSCLVYLPNKCQLHPLLSSSTTAPSSQSHPHQASLVAQ